jgi:hypothetical protein
LVKLCTHAANVRGWISRLASRGSRVRGKKGQVSAPVVGDSRNAPPHDFGPEAVRVNHAPVSLAIAVHELSSFDMKVEASDRAS